MLKFDIATYLSRFFNFVLSEILSNILWVSDILLFSEFINVVFVLFYNFIELIILLYTFLVISFVGYKQYMVHLISFSKTSDALPVFTCAIAIGNLWSICLGVSTLSPFPWNYACLASDN